MARIKISMPKEFVYETIVPLRITDINYGGHLGNDTVLSIVHEARVQFLKNYNFSEINVMGVGLIMADASIQYRSESFYGDQIVCKVTPSEYSPTGFELAYLLMNKKTEKEVARVKTNLICFDYELRKITQLPDGLKETFI